MCEWAFLDGLSDQFCFETEQFVSLVFLLFGFRPLSRDTAWSLAAKNIELKKENSFFWVTHKNVMMHRLFLKTRLQLLH